MYTDCAGKCVPTPWFLEHNKECGWRICVLTDIHLAVFGQFKTIYHRSSILRKLLIDKLSKKCYRKKNAPITNFIPSLFTEKLLPSNVVLLKMHTVRYALTGFWGQVLGLLRFEKLIKTKFLA